MKLFAAVLFVVLHVCPVSLKAAEPSTIDFLERNCGYTLSPAAVGKLDISMAPGGDSDFATVTITERNKLPGLVATLSCMLQPDFSGEVQKPSQIIAEQPRTGRYAVMVKWEREYQLRGWSPVVAYTDEILGDGSAINQHYYLVCDSQSARPCMEINFPLERRTGKAKTSRIIRLLDALSVASD